MVQGFPTMDCRCCRRVDKGIEIPAGSLLADLRETPGPPLDISELEWGFDLEAPLAASPRRPERPERHEQQRRQQQATPLAPEALVDRAAERKIVEAPIAASPFQLERTQPPRRPRRPLAQPAPAAPPNSAGCAVADHCVGLPQVGGGNGSGVPEAKDVSSSAAESLTTFVIELDTGAEGRKAKVGMLLMPHGEALKVAEVRQGLLGDWNAAHPELAVGVGDWIVGANGSGGDFRELLERIAYDRVLSLTICKSERFRFL
mmetsp:Transcript_134545/g.335719  ORF Transcript_134545/g.335719 Transcript_134545/m.335719 type:complete len:260 (-) Transcript_134545:42-821(-)